MQESLSVNRWSRRELLRAGSLGAVGLSLPRLLAAVDNPATGPAPKADACIIIFLNGGPSHLDMWDMKPAGPIEIRGEFDPIPSSLAGVDVCEHLPRLAQQMHRTTLIRSMNHSVNNSHAAAVYAALTGHDRGEQGGGAKPDDHPAPGAVLAKLRPTRPGTLPYITLPYKTKEGAAGPLQPGFLAGFMGATYDPFWVLDDPNAPQFHVRNLSLPAGLAQERMQARRGLLTSLNHGLEAQSNQTLDSLDDFQQQAFDLLTSNRAQRAFKLDAESDSVRERYGRNIYGQSVLLARRLIEADTRVVTMSWAPHANATWDTHGQNFRSLKTRLLPQFDAACSSLLEDLAQSGRLERTLVAVLGDFGRTPKINNNAGRDHWNSCYSILLAGGGIKPGFVYGASDHQGATPRHSPVTPGDIVATIYQLLGVDHQHLLYDTLNRPHTVVPEARIIHDLLA
ncbi:hypothetical protein Pan153_50400 [Gimesia panareensis]|uniref:Sulfatase n=1 Tax=Gimesia panareensis TaxID=2527978 RepID=A0A518FVN1_9PLAN|nr:DUF1501 domain-containing protein [Gimesia panareensis]QDV20365.1 hypothetical protein Pan153_50400 [Gimesia panareensis]